VARNKLIFQKRHSRSSFWLPASSRAPETQAGRGLKVAYLAAALSHVTPLLKAPQHPLSICPNAHSSRSSAGYSAPSKDCRSPKTKPFQGSLLKSKLHENKRAESQKS